MRFTAYHTCELRNKDYEQAFNGSPFKANTNNQWLTYGHYFWSNSIDSGIWWGKVHYKKKHKSFVVTQFDMQIDEEDVLDFIADSEAAFTFLEKSSKLYLAKCQQQARDDPKFNANPTMENCINYMKQQNLFPFKAIRACHKEHKSSGNILFTTHHTETLMPTDKHQVCIFDLNDVGNYTTNKIACYPKEYVEWFERHNKQ